MAHDLGHTPFGHAGEEALNDCMKRFGGFDHNIQTLRTILFLENRYYAFKGLNLTIETLDGLIKHNGPIKNLKKFKKILGVNYFKEKINFLIKNPVDKKENHSEMLEYVHAAFVNGQKKKYFKR